MNKILTTLVLLLTVASSAAPATAQDGLDPDLARRITPEVEVVRKVGPAVVFIETDTRVQGYNIFGQRITQERQGSGSGVVIFKEGYVVTNNHVIAGAQKIRVRFDPVHDATEYEADVVSRVPTEDLALLKIRGDGPFPTVELGRSDDLMLGERVLVIGNPYGQRHTVSAGIVSGLHRDVDVGEMRFTNLIQTDASINPGNSGGPLLNILGQLIGINTAMNMAAENIGFAIPIDRVKSVLEDHLLSPSQARAWLGFEVDLAHLVVASVVPGGPADAAGLRVGDAIQAIGDQRVTDSESYRLARLAVPPGSRTVLAVDRRGSRREVPLVGWNRVDGLILERLGARVEQAATFVQRRTFWGRVTRQPSQVLRVAALVPGGAAESIGLAVGDVLGAARVEGRQGSEEVIGDAHSLALLLSRLPPRTRLELDVQRDEDGDGVLELVQADEHVLPEVFRGVVELR